MCGVVALIGPSIFFDANVLDRMRDRLVHRGPDGAGSWIGKTRTSTIGLGHRRLSIIDLSDAASQPMVSNDGDVVVSYNGEIYNYKELRVELEHSGVMFRTDSDTEVLLQSYLKWGYDCVSHFNGMFAFVIWDSRNKKIFAARDRFGEKPLYYTQIPSGGLAFASEMKAFFVHPEIKAVPNEDHLAAYISQGPDHYSGETFFKGIKKLHGATGLIASEDGQIERMWQYWTAEVSEVDPDYDEKSSAEAFISLLKESLELRLRSDVPVAASVSGGLDSSLLVSLAAGLVNNRGEGITNTFSARFDDDPTLSEGKYIDQIAKYIDATSHSTSPSPELLSQESRLLHWHQEEPFHSPSMFAEWCVMRLTRENGNKVILNGQGADELLGGYQSYFLRHQMDMLERKQFWRFISESLMFHSRLYLEGFRYANSDRRFSNLISSSSKALKQPLQDNLKSWTSNFLSAGANIKASTVGVPEEALGNSFEQLLADGLSFSVLPEQLHSADRNGMAFGVEARSPFLDYKMVDFCLRLPERALIKNGWQKFILRKASKGYIPENIRWRVDKVGYASPTDLWLKGPLKSWSEQRLFGGQLSKLSFFKLDEVQTLWRQFLAGDSSNQWLVWRWISVSEWLALSYEDVWHVGLNDSLKYANI